MPYVTVRQTARSRQITLDDILNGEIATFFNPTTDYTTGTVTNFVNNIPPRLANSVNVRSMVRELALFNTKYAELHSADRASLYRTFHIPKKSGGYRRIDAPNKELSDALYELKDILENKMMALYHTSAFAYIRGRSTIDAVKRHQRNESRWFLKIDFSNFFGNTTHEFLMKTLMNIFPFSEMKEAYEYNQLATALELCFLNGGLPQGTPISPMLTNLMMIPIDHRLCNDLLKDGFIYTRYADDILISHRYSFRFTDMCARVSEVLKSFEAPFSLKREKTRYGSRNGENWNLGVMLNKDNEITIGRKRKDNLRSACHSYINDKRLGVVWDIHDVHVLAGQIAYYKMVEPEYVSGMLRNFNEKHSTDIMELIRRDLKGEC